MRSRKKIIITAASCAAILLLAYFAGYLPFYRSASDSLETVIGKLPFTEYLKNLVPLLMILSASAAGIILIVQIRRHGAEKNPQRAYERNSGSIRARRKAPVFMVIRWAVMIIFAVLMIFGGLLFGLKMASISIPVLSCPWNREQMTEASCYYLTHWNELFELPVGDILLFFGSTAAFIILLGRAVCGFLCPMGLIQDIMHKIRQRRKIEGIPPHERLYRTVKPVKWLMVLLFLGLCFAGGNFCNFCPAITVSPFLAGVSTSLYVSGFLMIFVLIASFFKRRVWCLVCPLGFLVGLFHRISLFRIKKDCTACTECGACWEACPMGIKTIYTEREKSDVTEADCIMCGECIRSCPEDNALSMTFAGKKLYCASRKQVMNAYQVKMKSRQEKIRND